MNIFHPETEGNQYEMKSFVSSGGLNRHRDQSWQAGGLGRRPPNQTGILCSQRSSVPLLPVVTKGLRAEGGSTSTG